jgi:lipopolysaccharide/colanic/teichoic acid biosynthesis glycosyltransferase
LELVVDTINAERTIKLEKASFYGTVKRLVDVLAASALLLSCLPLMYAAAILILLDGQGSPIFRQKRVGKNGFTFTLYKLRTMCDGSDQLGFCTEANDARITKMGILLRDTKIDELPQLWNVIKGEMSLIGPRPLSVEETNHLIETHQFDENTPGLIPNVRPGMTGWEQCTRSTLHPYEHRFQLNHYYETHLSLWLDMWVVKRTIFVCPLVCCLALLSAAVTICCLLFGYCY